MASKKFNNIYIKNSFSIAGPVEKQGSIKDYDLVMDDYYFNEKTFEQAEIKMQKTAIDNLLNQSKLINSEIDLLVAGDLSNQISVSCYAASHFSIPFFGVYSACASFTQSLIAGAEFLDNKRKGNVICVTSSHNLYAEKQFRFPVEYGAPKPSTTTFTATGAVACLLTKEETKIKLESYTIGKAIDMGCKDASHMGAVMAPAAANVIMNHLAELDRDINYYDLILTGDLGIYGKDILKDYMQTEYSIELKNYDDCGSMIYDVENQSVYAGASGPACAPLVTYGYIFDQMKKKDIRRVLLVATGALMNTTMVNNKNTIPAIAHAISLEVVE